MRGITALLMSAALVCGVLRPSDAVKHFQDVYSWSELDFVFPDADTRARMIGDHSFVPGAALPTHLEVDPHTGRMFLAMTKMKSGIPYSLATVTDTKNAKGEHMLMPYPDHAMHTKGCDGITTVEAIAIDECGRLWVVDTGLVYTEGLYQGETKACPAKLFVFDLKTDHLVKEFKFPDSFVQPESSFSSIVVDVISTDHECRDSFAYIADTGDFKTLVFDHAHDEAWMVVANEMYPYPEFGHFHYKGVHFDAMYGIYGMALTPKHEGEGRTLYFNSMASGKDSFVDTALLKNKTLFMSEPTHDVAYSIRSHVHTFPATRPGGQACMGPIVHDVLFYGSYQDSSVHCWNYKTPYAHENIAELDKDEDAFDMFAVIKAVTMDGGVPHLYVMSNSFEKFMFDEPSRDETHFRIVKAPVDKLIEGTVCAAPVTA